MDGFSHGFYSEEIDCSVIADADLYGKISLEDVDYEIVFSPKTNHFAGFSIYLTNQPDGNNGTVDLIVSDKNGKILDTIQVDLAKVKDSSWYKVRSSIDLRKGKEYFLTICAKECDCYPQLQTVDKDYLPKEVKEGDVLISFAYEESTFTFQNKVIFYIALISVWLLMLSFFFATKKLRYISGVMFITAVLTWTYMYNSMDRLNTTFVGFQIESEYLVTSTINAKQNNISHWDGSRYGFGRYLELLTDYTDENWLHNYSRTESTVIVDSNDYARRFACVGNSILFDNGECFTITDVVDDGMSIVIRLDAGKTMNFYKYGELSDAFYCDTNYTIIAPMYSAYLFPYESQYGLQGKIFSYMSLYMNQEEVFANLNLLCSLMTALVFAIIALLISVKFNCIFASIFLYTFWLSPWTVNFAKSLYWVEFTWFIPMAVGLFCAWKIADRRCRIISYLFAFIAVLCKCLCGYEYISVIMMGLILFLITDGITALWMHEKEKGILFFRTVLILGMVALAGFLVAICIHAQLKGQGDIKQGIINIFQEDVLRRTTGADINEYDGQYVESFNASVWETVCKYFHFDTEIVTGLNGNLFPLLCIVPIGIFVWDVKKKQVNVRMMCLYIMSFLTSVSWFCLAKGHSFIHTHINFVLWYFAYVQTCIYIIVTKVTRNMFR